MKNILRVFKNDLNKIHNNVIAMIVIMGILVIPTLMHGSILRPAGIRMVVRMA